MELRKQLLNISNEDNELNTEVLDKVVETGKTYMVRKLLYSRSYLETKFCNEIINNNLKTVKMFIRAGIDVCLRDYLPIHLAFRTGSKEMIRLIIKEMESQCCDGKEKIASIINEYNYLAIAAQNGQIEIVELLLEYHKKRLNIIDLDQISLAIYLATDSGCIETVRVLVQNTGRGFIEDKTVMLAVEKGYTPIFEIFFKEKESIVDIIYKEKTLLEVAAKNGHIDIVRLLIKKMRIIDIFYYKTDFEDQGYSCEHSENVREYAIKLAAQNGHNEIVELLEKTKKSEE